MELLIMQITSTYEKYPQTNISLELPNMACTSVNFTSSVYDDDNLNLIDLSGEPVSELLLLPATSSINKHHIRHKKTSEQRKSSCSHHMFIKTHSIFLQLRNRISNGFNKNNACCNTHIPGSVSQTSSACP
jgi:hypothetical protein